MKCIHCHSGHLVGVGHTRSGQRYLCRGCGRVFIEHKPRFSLEQNARALEYYTNNTGVRKRALCGLLCD